MTIFEPTPPVQPAEKVLHNTYSLTQIQFDLTDMYKRIGGYVVTSQCLGTGSFATVHLALDPIKHRQVACKSIRTKKDNEVEQVMKEVRILMTLRHVSSRIIQSFLC